MTRKHRTHAARSNALPCCWATLVEMMLVLEVFRRRGIALNQGWMQQSMGGPFLEAEDLWFNRQR